MAVFLKILRFAGLLAVAAPALALTINDPTAPPTALRDESAAETILTPQLQSVFLPRGGKGMALIDGQQVVLGGKLGERRLIALSEHEAVLEGPGGIERLRLTPEAEKVMLRPRPVSPRRVSDREGASP